MQRAGTPPRRLFMPSIVRPVFFPVLRMMQRELVHKDVKCNTRSMNSVHFPCAPAVSPVP